MCDFKMGVIKWFIELLVMQFWSEIILVISEIPHTCMIPDQIALHFY